MHAKLLLVLFCNTRLAWPTELIEMGLKSVRKLKRSALGAQLSKVPTCEVD